MLLLGVGACGEAALKAQSSNAQTIGSTPQTPPFRPQIIKPQIIQPSAKAAPLVKAARDRLSALVVYVGLDYPGDDAPAIIGVCKDVVIRSYHAAYGFDFQKAVHEYIRQNFSAYPTTWGTAVLTKTSIIGVSRI